MTDLLSLGKLYVSDFLAPGEQPRSEPHDLTLVMDDDTGIVHLAAQPPPELMWGRYWYRSGTNATMRDELAGIVRQIVSVAPLKPGDTWVDIASNDGTLLSWINRTHGAPTPMILIGVDPCNDHIALEARQHALIIQEPFTSNVASNIVADWDRAKVVTCIAMFYDLLDPTDFLAGVRHLLADDGIFVLQMSYTPLMQEQMAFDNICHEHARYYTLDTLQHVLWEGGFSVVDCQINDTNGGSFRVYAMHRDADRSAFATQPYRDVAAMRVRSILALEQAAGSNEVRRWRDFAERLRTLRRHILEFVEKANSEGKTIWGLGASTKANTMWQWLGLNADNIEAIGERQPAKWGLRCVGSDIPIASEDEMRAARPDYLWVGPWHFHAEIVEREAKYLAGGGKLVFPMPRFEIVGG